jgi:outer membrane protein OmpA-like peptidoglycan-associated protein
VRWTNFEEYVMKKSVIAISLSALLSSQPLLAGETPAEIDKTSLKSTASGVLIGALLGGPPGMLIGLAGGAWVGEMENRQQAYEVQAGALAEAQRQTAQRHLAYKELLSATRARLSAMQEGFAFCLGFRSDSAEIEPHIASQLGSLAQMLKAFPELNLQILAGADRRGSEDHNLNLSQVRAEAVARALRNAGLAASRIQIRYIGEAAAVYEPGDLEGLSFDRVVKLTLVHGEAS